MDANTPEVSVKVSATPDRKWADYRSMINSH